MARHQITQLVAAAELNPATVHLVEVVEVVGLEHLVGELCQAHAIGALQPGLNAVAAQHGTHPEVPTGLRKEVHHAPVLEPAQVVKYGHGAQRTGAVAKVKLVVGHDPLDAFPDAAGVHLGGLRGQTLPFACLAARVPDLRGGSSEHRQHVVARVPEVQQADEGQQIAHMKAVSRGVETAVNSLSARLKQPWKPVLSRVLRKRFLQDTTLVERVEKSFQESRGLVVPGAQRKLQSRSPEQDTRSMPPYMTGDQHPGRRHVCLDVRKTVRFGLSKSPSSAPAVI